jgi:hypothetical protein
MDEYIVTFGKHKGLTYAQVKEQFPEYCKAAQRSKYTCLKVLKAYLSGKGSLASASDIANEEKRIAEWKAVKEKEEELRDADERFRREFEEEIFSKGAEELVSFDTETFAMLYVRVMKKEPPACLRHSPKVNCKHSFTYDPNAQSQPMANLKNHWKHFVGDVAVPNWMESQVAYRKMINLPVSSSSDGESSDGGGGGASVKKGYVYFLQKAEHFGTNIYKLQKAADFINKRSKATEYRNANIFGFFLVSDMNQCEKDLKKVFDGKFPFDESVMPANYQHGREDFMGDCQEMIREFIGIVLGYVVYRTENAEGDNNTHGGVH